MTTIVTTTIWPCPTCHTVWRFQPRVEQPTCLRCDYDWTHTLSTAEATAQGIDVAAALADHTTRQMHNSRLARVLWPVMLVAVVVKTVIDDWGQRLEGLAKEAHSL